MKVLVTFGILGIIAISRQAPTSPPGENSQDCPQNNTSPRTFRHPTSCHKYLQCANGTKFELECPIGQHYNNILGVCDSPRFANCTLVSDESSTTAPSNIVTANGHSITTVPSNIVPVHGSTESSGNTTNTEINKDDKKSKGQIDVTTENTTRTPSDKNETVTSKVETSSQGSVDKDSGKQNETSITTSTELIKRSNETGKGVDTTASTKETSSAKPPVNTTTPAGASVTTGEIQVKDESESTTEEDSAEKEEDKKPREKNGEKPVSAESKPESVEKVADKKISEMTGEKSAESKPETSTEGHKKEEASTKPDDSKEVSKPGGKPEITTQAKDGAVEPRKMQPKDVTKTDNISKEKVQPELGGEEEKKKDDGKKTFEESNENLGA